MRSRKHAFGVGFRRFLRRGQANVFTETLLYAMAFNLNNTNAEY
jgi:hypothetical protein